MNNAKRFLVIAAALGLAAGLVACSTVQVSTDYDSTANFSQYKTFSFMPMTEFNSITAGRIQAAITQALQARGLSQASGTADLQISVFAKLSQETQVSSTGMGYGWGRGWRGGGGTATIQNVAVGTLVVDLVDVSTNKLVWRGTASDTIQQTSSGQEKQEALDSAMTKLFAKYPPEAGR